MAVLESMYNTSTESAVYSTSRSCCGVIAFAMISLIKLPSSVRSNVNYQYDSIRQKGLVAPTTAESIRNQLVGSRC
jgi:hypothetical protein